MHFEVPEHHTLPPWSHVIIVEGFEEQPIQTRGLPGQAEALVPYHGAMLRTFLSRLLKGKPNMLAPGSPCPSFHAVDCDGTAVSLADLSGHRFVLWFYPKADTPG